MARFLIGTIPVAGHVAPALPIAQELLKQGHEVWWYTGSLFRTRVETSGAHFVPITTGVDLSDPKTIPPSWTKERQALKGLAQLKFDLKRAFIETAPNQVKDLTQILNQFAADVILADSFFLGASWMYELGGPLWAEFGVGAISFPSRDTAPFGLGLPPNKSAWGRWRNQALHYLLGQIVLRDVVVALDHERQRLGLPPRGETVFDLLSPLLYLAGTIPEFEYPRSDLPPQVHFLGPLLSSLLTEFAPPSWWRDLETASLVVHVTQGTVATQAQDLIIPTLKALAKEKCLVVATTGNQPVEIVNLDPIPANARVETFLSYDHLLPHVDIMITNGGFNGVLMALSQGIPLISAGQSEDKPEICRRIEWSGVGVNLRTKTPTPSQIRRAFNHVKDQPKYRERAKHFQSEIKRYAAPKHAVTLLERLVDSRQPVLRKDL